MIDVEDAASPQDVTDAGTSAWRPRPQPAPAPEAVAAPARLPSRSRSLSPHLRPLCRCRPVNSRPYRCASIARGLRYLPNPPPRLDRKKTGKDESAAKAPPVRPPLQVSQKTRRKDRQARQVRGFAQDHRQVRQRDLVSRRPARRFRRRRARTAQGRARSKDAPKTQRPKDPKTGGKTGPRSSIGRAVATIPRRQPCWRAAMRQCRRWSRHCLVRCAVGREPRSAIRRVQRPTCCTARFCSWRCVWGSVRWHRSWHGWGQGDAGPGSLLYCSVPWRDAGGGRAGSAV